MVEDWKNVDVGLPWAVADSVGMSQSALDARLSPWLKHLVDSEHDLPMACALVARKGKAVFYKGYGASKEGKSIQHDSIFRIYSMTKPITSLALMMLWEEGKVLLEDPVHLYLGEKWKKKNMRVLENHGETPKPCKRTIRVRHLLTHTAGLSYGFLAQPGANPVDELYISSARKVAKSNESAEEMAERIAGIPLCHEPGEQWNYSFATDIVGRLVEVISGMSLSDFFQQRIFGPLDMRDTAFSLHEDDLERFVNIHMEHLETGKKIDITHVQTKHKEYTAFKRLHSGGGGLVSTFRDYARFCQFCLNGGELDGVRLVGRKTFELMTLNHLKMGKDLQQMSTPSSAYMAIPGYGFGLGFAVCLDQCKSGYVESNGTFYWGGAANTIMFCDPKEELFAMFYTQVLNLNDLKLPLRRLFCNMVYSCITDKPSHAKL